MGTPRRIGLLLLLCAAANAASPGHIPEGWVFVEVLSFDTIAGGFHDRSTDLYVSVEAGGAGDIAPSWKGRPAARRVEKLGLGGRPVERLVEPAGRPGCTTHEIRVPRPGRFEWSVYFWATLCNGVQEARYRGLVEALPAPFGEGAQAEEGPFPWPTRSTLEGLRVGDTWEAIAPRLGVAMEVDPRRRGGFEVVYEIDGADLVLEFDRDQRLVAKAQLRSRSNAP